MRREVIDQEVPQREISPAFRPLAVIVAAGAVALFVAVYIGLSSDAEAARPAEMPKVLRDDLEADKKSAAAILALGAQENQALAARAADAGTEADWLGRSGRPPKVSEVLDHEDAGALAWAPLGAPEEGAGLEIGADGDVALSPEKRLALQEERLRNLVDQHVERVQQQKLQRREQQLARAELEVEGAGAGGATAVPRSPGSSVDEGDGELSGLTELKNQLLHQSASQMQARSTGALGGLGSFGELGGFGPAASGGFGGGMAADRELAAMTREGQKLDFFQHGGEQLRPGYLPATVQKPMSKYELKMGSIIPGMLVTAIHSESPGQIAGVVTENVYDSVTGRYLLIPQGSKLVGTYSGAISMGQERVQVAAVRLNFPNGDTLDLGGMSMADSEGRAGLHDKVNRHFWRRVAAFLLNSAATVGYEMTAPQTALSPEGVMHRALGQSIMQMANEMAQRESQIPPTLEIRQGERFVVHVSADIVFPGGYQDGFEHRRRPRTRRGRSDEQVPSSRAAGPARGGVE